MNRTSLKFATILCAFQLLCGVSLSHAQSSRLNPQLTAEPNNPPPNTPFVLRILDVTGVAANIKESSAQVSGNAIEIRASIELGYISIGQGYVLPISITPLPAGMYNVTYIARTKHPDTLYTEYFVEGRWQVLVVDDQSKRAAIEFYHSALDHYFITIDEDEIAALDGHIFAGWERTGEVITVLAPGSSYGATFPVCRFYGRLEAGLNTHFYSGNAYECELLGSDPSWILERIDAFRVAFVAEQGVCPVNMTRVYRLWNGLAAPNHRYTTSTATQQAMAAKGWIPEGSGTPPAVWCAIPIAQPQ